MNVHVTKLPEPHETREGLRALIDTPELFRIARENPRGLPDRDSNDRVLREVVSVFQRGLVALGLRLKLRLEPVTFDPKAGVRSPTRLSIFDGDCRWALAIQTLDNAVLCGERLCVTRGDDAVARLSETLLREIERVLGAHEGDVND